MPHLLSITKQRNRNTQIAGLMPKPKKQINTQLISYLKNQIETNERGIAPIMRAARSKKAQMAYSWED
ncbi:hypothetical protein [Halothiobacillus sp.]|uniref:hypothetical protein n=1 Tax=Halothiobacillus sp. TaxID=1891311 RepID=UPI002AD1D594|nr:hypothetical protein [Halothiobacillus sp.]